MHTYGSCATRHCCADSTDMVKLGKFTSFAERASLPARKNLLPAIKADMSKNIDTHCGTFICWLLSNNQIITRTAATTPIILANRLSDRNTTNLRSELGSNFSPMGL